MSRKTEAYVADPPFVLATAAELRSIFARAFAEITAALERDRLAITTPAENRRLYFAMEGLRFGCIAAATLGDVELTPLVARALDLGLLFGFAHHGDTHLSQAGTALVDLLRRGAPLDDEVKALAEHGDDRLRVLVARGLPARGDAEIALLEELAEDPSAGVRKAAADALSEVREVAWWRGKFRSDPAARLTPEQALRHKRTFERISALLDQGRRDILRDEDELVSLGRKLPKALSLELCEVVLGAPARYEDPMLKLGAWMVTLPGGLDAFVRLCPAWADVAGPYSRGEHTAKMLLPLRESARRAACLKLMTLAVAAPARERARFSGGVPRLLAEIAGHAFPAGDDLSPLLDAVLALGPLSPGDGDDDDDDRDRAPTDWVVHGLAEAFSAPGADPGPVLDRALAARVDGYPGAWAPISRAVDTLLTRAPGPALREATERAVRSDHQPSVVWGLEQILGRAHDPARDPPLPDLLARLAAEPRYRKAMLASFNGLDRRVAPIARAALREGRIGLDDAARALSAAGRLWGGTSIFPEGSTEDREAAAAFLGPPELQGPPREDEWASMRALRRRAAAEGQPWSKALVEPLPPGAWAEEDRSIFEAALAALPSGDAPGELAVAQALSAKPAPEMFPRFEALRSRCSERVKGLVDLWRDQAAKALGMKVPGPGEEEADAAAKSEAPPGPKGELEWMDEPEE